MTFTWKKINYLGASFFAGFSLMVIEICASRVVAPLVGSSLYSWTSIIGTIILGLAIGSLTGGYLADQKEPRKYLAWAFFISALMAGLIPYLSAHADFIIQSDLSIFWVTLLLTFYFFLLPAIALGLIQPLILKIFADNWTKLGREYGLLSTLWSLGSILGVFLTGYLFIAYWGTDLTLYLTIFVLFIFFFFFFGWKREIFTPLAILIVVSLFVFSEKTDRTAGVVYEKDSAYYKIKIIDSKALGFGLTRLLFLDFDLHSYETQKHPNGFYTEIYPLFQIFNQNIKKIHVIGAGAYTLPKNFAAFYPLAEIEVSEIDPKLESLIQKYFTLDTKKIKTVVGDARLFFNQSQEKYDLIYGDAYNSFISIPWHLLTKEFLETIKKHLADGGLYAVNIIGKVKGEGSDLFASVNKTFAAVFPTYYTFAFDQKENEVQNITLVGVNNNEKLSGQEIKKALSAVLYGPFIITLFRENIPLSSSSIVLTDDLAPVERLMTPAINEYFKPFLQFQEELKK